MPCGNSIALLPTPALSQLRPELLGRTTARTSGWDYSNALQFATQPANTAFLPIHNSWKKKKSHCCLGMQRDASALKDSLNHCWHCVTTASLEKTLQLVSIPRGNLPPVSKCNPYCMVIYVQLGQTH